MVSCRPDAGLDGFGQQRNRVSIHSIEEVETILIGTTYNERNNDKRPMKEEIWTKLENFCKIYLGESFQCVLYKGQKREVYEVAFERKTGRVSMNKNTTPNIQRELNAILEAADIQGCGLTIEVRVIEEITGQRQETRRSLGQ